MSGTGDFHCQRKTKSLHDMLTSKTAEAADVWPPSLLPSKACAIVLGWWMLQNNQILAVRDPGRGTCLLFDVCSIWKQLEWRGVSFCHFHPHHSWETVQEFQLSLLNLSIEKSKKTALAKSGINMYVLFRTLSSHSVHSSHVFRQGGVK